MRQLGARSRKFRDRATLVLLGCLILSVVLHFTIGPLLVWLFGVRFSMPPAQQQPVYVAISSATRIEHRTVPRRAALPVQPRPQRQPQPKPRPAVARQAAPRREIARITPQATISAPRLRSIAPQHGLSSQALVQQETQFENTIERAREAEDPVISAAQPHQTPAATKASKIDVAGEMGIQHYGQGILEPVKSWKDGEYDYYYVHYWVQYPDGSTETGDVPWPIRFPASNDPLGRGFHHLPLPKPLPDYVLPSDAQLQPLVAFCYEHRADLPSCPIQRD